jgi:hypothetical protein
LLEHKSKRPVFKKLQKHNLELPTAPPVIGRIPRPPQRIQSIDDTKDPAEQKPASLTQVKGIGVAAVRPDNQEFDEATAQRIGDLLQEFVVGLDSKKEVRRRLGHRPTASQGAAAKFDGLLH